MGGSRLAAERHAVGAPPSNRGDSSADRIRSLLISPLSWKRRDRSGLSRMRDGVAQPGASHQPGRRRQPAASILWKSPARRVSARRVSQPVLRRVRAA